MDLLIFIVAFLLATLVGVLFVALYRMRRRITEQETRLAALTRRVFDLEIATVAPVALAQEIPIAEPAASIEAPAPDVPVTTEKVRPPKEDWEAVIGGNWLNRIGALVLVIGIALFLGYSLTQLGAAGKVAIGFAVGLSMLIGGVSLRSSERYGSFALSLVGAGWAVVYFTAYASHALQPARVIESSFDAGLLLFTVSAGMILHALSYGSEIGTALAFLFSFVGLNVAPLSGFSLYAGVLLALSILGLAYARGWFRLAITGVVLSYATFILRRDPAEALAPWALWIQWAAFEAYDIVDLLRRRDRRTVDRSLFLLNAVGFVGASLLYRWDELGWFLFVAAAAYLASSLVRARYAVQPAGSVDGYEGAFAASAALMAGALIDRFNGTAMTLALLVEGEMIVVAGHALGSRFIRAAGAAVLSLAFIRVMIADPWSASKKREWTPIAALMAAVFAANRLRGGWAYTAGAGILIGSVVNAEVAREWVAFVLAALGTGALALALRFQLRDVRLQHLAWAMVTFFAGWIALDYGRSATLAVAMTAASFYVCQFLIRGLDRYAPTLYSLLGTSLFVLLLFEEVQGRLLTVAFGIQGAALLVAGLLASDRVLRISGLVLFLVCIAKAFLYDLRQLDTFSRILSFIVLGLLLLGASWVYTRFRERVRRLL